MVNSGEGMELGLVAMTGVNSKGGCGGVVMLYEGVVTAAVRGEI